MTTPFVQRIRLDGFLSFPPGSLPIELRPLNVLIGPNGAGKSNLLEAFSLLAQLCRGVAFQAAPPAGVVAAEWLWRGASAWTIEVEGHGEERRFDYKLTWTARGAGGSRGSPTDFRTDSAIDRGFCKDGTSILDQRNTPEAHLDNVWLAEQFARMREFRRWSFGRFGFPPSAQHTQMPTDGLLPDGSNLGTVLQELAHRGRLDDLNARLRRFLPRAERLTTLSVGGAILPYLEEEGVPDPIPAGRLSDGTLRFIALLVTLLSDPPPPLVCIEVPEMGLHPGSLGRRRRNPPRMSRRPVR